MNFIDVEAQAELDKALAKVTPNDVIVCTGSGSFRISGSAQVRAFDSAQVEAFDSAQVEASKYVAVTAHGTRVKVTGGVLIQPPPLDEIATWTEFHGVETKRGRLVVFKALNAELNSGHGFAYVPGTTVEAPDWRDTNACGRGLHFGPTPHHALAYHEDATRFVACEVKASEARAITDGYGRSDKIKAPSCEVLYECDRDGEPLKRAASA